MRDPVLCVDSQSYERSAMQAWLKEQGTAPLPPHAPMHGQKVILNHALRNMIQEILKAKHIDRA